MAVGDAGEVLGGRELNVGGDIGGVKLCAGVEVFKTHFVENQVDKIGIAEIGDLNAAFDINGVGSYKLEILASVIYQCERKSHLSILLRDGHGYLVGGEVGVVNAGDGDHAAVARGPCRGRPELEIAAAVVIYLGLVNAFLEGVFCKRGQVVGALYGLGN